MINEARFETVAFDFRFLIDFFLAIPYLMAEGAMDSN
jgi:hypothetical protein